MGCWVAPHANKMLGISVNKGVTLFGEPWFATDTIVPGNLIPSLDWFCCYKCQSKSSFHNYRGHGSGNCHVARGVVHIPSKLVHTTGGIKALASPGSPLP